MCGRKVKIISRHIIGCFGPQSVSKKKRNISRGSYLTSDQLDTLEVPTMAKRIKLQNRQNNVFCPCPFQESCQKQKKKRKEKKYLGTRSQNGKNEVLLYIWAIKGVIVQLILVDILVQVSP